MVKVTRLLNAVMETLQNGKPTSITESKVYGWRTMTRITDIGGDLQAESSGWVFKSPFAGGGGILWRPHYRLHCFVTLCAKLSGAVYCNRSCLWRAGVVTGGRCPNLTTASARAVFASL